MEIQRDSWHYKLYIASYSQQHFPAQNTNLCKYFWRVVLGACVWTVLAAVVAVLAGCIGFLFYKHTLVACATAGSLAAIIGGMFLYVYVSELLDERAYNKTRQPGYKEPEPGLLRAYLRAKKAKVCPLITFAKAGKNQ